MPTDIRDVIKKMTPAQRKKVKARSAELIAEELTLQELRKARNITQTNLSKLLGIGQDQISKMEKRKDLKLSTIAEYVEAIGGSLSLVVDFPDRKPVVLASIPKSEPKSRKPVQT
jgi:transcriptional regulator with XRE-family HTH domain